MKKEKQIHPAIPELKNQMEKGKLSRREFMRYSALLGLSFTAAAQIAGLALPRRAAAADIKRGRRPPRGPAGPEDRSPGPFLLADAFQCHPSGLGVHDLHG